MRRRSRDGAAETGQHPVRALFDLMLALVLVLAAVVVAQHRAALPLEVKAKEQSDKQPSHTFTEQDAGKLLESELLLLHNVARRRENPNDTELYKSIAELPKVDKCYIVEKEMPKNDPRTIEERQAILELHRSELYAQVEKSLHDQLLGTRITRVVGQDELRFASASATPTDQSQLPSIIAVVRQRYSEGYHRIRIEGHTDTVAIKTVQFPSNWELSAARAIFLSKAIEQDFEKRSIPLGVKGITVEAIGYGERQPIAANVTEEGRRQNRRIRIVFEK